MLDRDAVDVVFDDFGDPADIGRDAREFCRHRLKERIWEALFARRKYERYRMLSDICLHFGAPVSVKRSFELVFLDKAFYFFPFRPFSDDEKWTSLCAAEMAANGGVSSALFL